MSPDKYKSCVRCGTPFPATFDAINTWATWVSGDTVKGIICPDCTTDEEHAESSVREALDRPAQTFQISSEDVESIWLEAKVYGSGTTEYNRGFREGLRRALHHLNIHIEESP